MMLSDLAQQLADQLAEHGDVAVQIAVATGPGATRTLPELVLTGEPDGAGSVGQRAAAVLNELGRRQVEAGAFEAGQVTEVRGQRVRLAGQHIAPLVLVRKLYGRHHDIAALRADPWVLGR